ncbi:ankyrin repeat-containing protein At5g02620-like [Diospyros lotus]|uniref:ankyrin repeat-containing protein At5g02620-like n=1 Tax=Diospyros lotus TaxID=55363 RepID=UPI00224E49DF|nr:ankyrin repeat-containing protein At5g02620-like [Diospyros lotus]
MYQFQQSMDERLRKAAEQGNVDTLYVRIKENVHDLESIDGVPFIDTPLHIAASRGHMEFAMEIMNLKPSFARKLNQDGLSPMHLALLNDHDLLVFWLLSIDKGLIRVKARGGKTPLHYSAEKGNWLMLVRFFEAIPKSIKDVTYEGDTALHIAVENGNIEALQVLIEWNIIFRRELLIRKNKEEKTALEIAASRGQQEMVELLEANSATNLKNILEDPTQISDGIRRMLRNFFPSPTNSVEEKIAGMSTVHWIKISSEQRSAQIFVDGLIATVAYQAIVNPPGGVWQGSAKNDSPVSILTKNFGISSSPARTSDVGTSVMNTSTFFIFWLANCVVFVFSVARMIQVISNPSRTGIERFYPIPLYVLLSCFLISAAITAPSGALSHYALEYLIGAVILLGLSCLHRILAELGHVRRSHWRTRDGREWWQSGKH